MGSPSPLPEEYLADPDRYFMEWIPRRLEEDADLKSRAGSSDAVAQIRLTGERGGEWHFVLGGGEVEVERGTHAEPSFTLTMAVDTWRRMRKGEQNAVTAFFTGKIKLKGSVRAFIRVIGLFS